MNRPTATEKELMAALIAWFQQLGYLTAHIPDALYALAAGQGRYDALAGAGGLPDIIAVGHGHLIVVECKSDTGKTDETQDEWLAAFGQVESDRVHVIVARPDDQDRVIDLMIRCREESWRAA